MRFEKAYRRKRRRENVNGCPAAPTIRGGAQKTPENLSCMATKSAQAAVLDRSIPFAIHTDLFYLQLARC